MKKIDRQELILDIIKNNEIETQEELAEQLAGLGIDVKQSTLSRDIKQLKLTKVASSGDKRYKYVSIDDISSEKAGVPDNGDKLIKIFKQTVISMERVDKFIVVKTMSGAGNAAAEALDVFELEGVAGTIAGDNTIFLLVRTDEEAKKIMSLLNEIADVEQTEGNIANILSDILESK